MALLLIDMVQPYIVWGRDIGDDDEAYANAKIKSRASCAQLWNCTIVNDHSTSSSNSNSSSNSSSHVCKTKTMFMVWEVLGSFTVDETFLETSPHEDFPPHGTYTSNQI